MVVLAAWCSVRRSSTATPPLVTVGAYGTNSLSSSPLMVLISWLIVPMASSSCAWWLLIWAISISDSSVAFSFLGLLGASRLEAVGDVELLVGWVYERVLRSILVVVLSAGLLVEDSKTSLSSPSSAKLLTYDFEPSTIRWCGLNIRMVFGWC